MLFERRQIKLKDGRAALLRNPESEKDASEMIRVLTQMCGESEFLLRTPEECTWTVDQERKVLSDINAADGRLMLVCEVEGRIAGMCGLNLYPQVKFRHRADVDIGILKACWGQGIGTAMFTALIDAARGRGVELLELDYIEGNARGKALYEKMGFVQYGEHPQAVRLPNGSYRNLILMQKRL